MINKTFRQLIESSSLDTLEKLVQYIEARIKEGEIVNPDFVELKSRVNKVYELADRQMKDLILGTDGRNDILNDVYYDLPMYPTSFSKVKKTLKKAEKEFPEICKTVEAYVAQWDVIPGLMKTLKGLVVTTQQVRDRKKAVEQASFETKKANMDVLVKELESTKQEYIARAKKSAQAQLDTMYSNLEKSDWNLYTLFPGNDKETKQRRMNYQMVTDNNYSKSSNTVDYREWNKDSANRWLEREVQGAEMNFDAFVAKMIQKVGSPVVTAELKGNIWTNALLTVTTSTGETQVYKTQIILNVSKYGNLFNQFPTRRK